MTRGQEVELEVLVRARYPLLYVVSGEERRVESALARVAARCGKKLLLWSATRGLADLEQVADKGTREPRAVLDFIGECAQQAIFVLRDFHPYLQDPILVRKLRDLVHGLKSSHKSVVLLSPVLTLPPELEKDVTVIDWELPDADELRALLREALASSHSGTRFQVDLRPGDEERLVQAALGMTLEEAENAFARAIVTDNKMSGDDVAVILAEKKQIIRKSRLLEYHEAAPAMGAIGGLELLKDWLRKRGRAFTQKARDFGLPQPRGVLLLGVQGCGKSLSCKAIAALWTMPLLRLDMGSIFGGFVGQSEENMRRAIRTAESIAPCILWLDEIEKGLAGSHSSSTSDAGTTARVFSTFLTWLQEKTKPVFVAATANRIDQLPPELLRKGRLDEIFFIDLPTLAERREIFAIHLRGHRRDPAGFRLDDLAAASEGWSGAEIEQAVITALYDAFHGDRELTQADLVAALLQAVPLSRTMAEEIETQRQWARTRARPASSRPEPPPQRTAARAAPPRAVSAPDTAGTGG